MERDQARAEYQKLEREQRWSRFQKRSWILVSSLDSFASLSFFLGGAKLSGVLSGLSAICFLGLARMHRNNERAIKKQQLDQHSEWPQE